MKHLEDEIMKVCEGSTYAQSIHALVQVICMRHYINLANDNTDQEVTHDFLRKECHKLYMLIERQMQNLFLNDIFKIRDLCIKKDKH